MRIHDLRHTFASSLINSGHSLFVAQKILGHAHPATTMRYAHLEKETLLEAANTAARCLRAGSQTQSNSRFNKFDKGMFSPEAVFLYILNFLTSFFPWNGQNFTFPDRIRPNLGLFTPLIDFGSIFTILKECGWLEKIRGLLNVLLTV